MYIDSKTIASKSKNKMLGYLSTSIFVLWSWLRTKMWKQQTTQLHHGIHSLLENSKVKVERKISCIQYSQKHFASKKKGRYTWWLNSDANSWIWSRGREKASGEQPSTSNHDTWRDDGFRL